MHFYSSETNNTEQPLAEWGTLNGMFCKPHQKINFMLQIKLWIATVHSHSIREQTAELLWRIISWMWQERSNIICIDHRSPHVFRHHKWWPGHAALTGNMTSLDTNSSWQYLQRILSFVDVITDTNVWSAPARQCLTALGFEEFEVWVSVLLLGKCELMSHIKIWLNQWIRGLTWQSNVLDSDLSVECQDVTHGSLWHLMTRDASLAPVTLSRLSHITESALIEAWPLCIGGDTRHSPGCSKSPALWTRSRASCTDSPRTLQRREREGARPGAETKRELRLSEESHLGLGAGKPGPYKEMVKQETEKRMPAQSKSRLIPPIGIGVSVFNCFSVFSEWKGCNCSRQLADQG